MRTFKNILKILFIAFVLSVSIFLLWMSNRYTVPIMMYHNVEDIDHHEANWVSPDSFNMHMKFLSDNEYNVITLEAFVEMTRTGATFPRKTVVLTFDDAYTNNYENALPILKTYNFPAMLFVPTDRVGTDNHLTWSQIEEMKNSGIFTIGSHGLEGGYFPGYSIDEQKKQIEVSKKILEQRLGVQVDYIAYPIGGFSESIKKMVQVSGYRAAVATNRGYDRYNKDLFEINRIRFSNKDNSSVILRVKLSGYYNMFRKYKHPY